jgi:hypothetical protein
MKPPKKTLPPSDHDVGYGKPPVHTRFRKGASGNPGGRPRGMTPGRAKALALKEAYRLLTVRVGDELITMPAIQVVLRSHVGIAAKGNGPAQRFLFQTVQAIEQELAVPRAANNACKTDTREVSTRDMAKALLLALHKPADEDGQT